MKKCLKHGISLFIGLIMVLTSIAVMPWNQMTVSAISCRKDYFNKNYTLSGNMAEDVVTIAKAQEGRTGAQFGYTENWCDEFVADCIENAGADSSIVAHGGTVADFESKMRARNAKQVSSPQPGDLVFFTFSHVEIVSKVVNGVPYSVGGNNGGTGYYGTNYCRAEHKVSTTGSVRLYLRPNYKKSLVDKAPTWAHLDKNQVWYDLKDIIVLTPSSDTATGYWISITKDGKSVVNEHINGAYSIAANSLGIGEYHTWISAANSTGSIDSNHLDFSVVGSATYANIYTFKNNYSLKETVSIHVDTICAKGQVIGIDKIGSGRVITEGCESTYTIEANKLGVGKYSAYFSVYNGSGSIDTKRVEFSIYDKLISPTPTISTLSTSSLKLTWKAEPNATSYRIDRRKSGDGTAYETIATTKDTKYTDTGLEANTKYWYRVYAVAGSDKSSEKNSVSGTTYTLTSPTPTISTLSTSSLKLTWKSASNATSYRIDRRKSGDGTAYETIATTKNTTYTDTGLEANTKYWYRVYAVADYTSSEKNSVSGTTYTLTSPTPTISTLSTSSLKLTWKSASNATSYRIDRRKSGDGTAYETIATTKNTTYTDTGLEANTKYWYRVYAVADYTSSEKNSVSGTTDKAVTNCNIKLYDNGQCLSESLVKSGTKLDEFLLPTMSKSGYKFEGWYTAKNGGTMYPIGSIVPNAKELILYAHWTKIEIKGDINQDNKLTMTDAVLLQKHILNLKSLSDEQLKLADINNDSKVNIFDLSLLKASLK